MEAFSVHDQHTWPGVLEHIVLDMPSLQSHVLQKPLSELIVPSVVKPGSWLNRVVPAVLHLREDYAIIFTEKMTVHDFVREAATAMALYSQPKQTIEGGTLFTTDALSPDIMDDLRLLQNKGITMEEVVLYGQLPIVFSEKSPYGILLVPPHINPLFVLYQDALGALMTVRSRALVDDLNESRIRVPLPRDISFYRLNYSLVRSCAHAFDGLEALTLSIRRLLINQPDEEGIQYVFTLEQLSLLYQLITVAFVEDRIKSKFYLASIGNTTELETLTHFELLNTLVGTTPDNTIGSSLLDVTGKIGSLTNNISIPNRVARNMLTTWCMHLWNICSRNNKALGGYVQSLVDTSVIDALKRKLIPDTRA